MLAFLFDLVWVWYVPALVEGLAVTLVLLILESLLARSRHVWTEVRTFLLYLVFLKLVVPPQLKLPTGVVSDVVGWVVSSLRSLPLQLAGTSLSAVPGQSGPEVLWEYVHLEPVAALTWIWLPLLGWLVGFGFYMLSIRRTARQFRSLCLEGIEPPESLRTALSWAACRLRLRTIPGLRVSVDISVPFVAGLHRPIVLFPAGLIERLSMDEVRQVFLHELSHVRRRDCWVQHAICFLQALFWPNLLLHKVRRRLNHLQDLGCDAAAISQHPDRSPVAYRRMLLKVAGRALGLSLPDPRQGLGLLRRPSQIMERLRFTEQRWRTTPRVRLLGAATLALLVATFLFPMGSEPAGRPGEGLSPHPVMPLVEAVEFIGNRILSDRDLLQLVATRAGNAYDPERLYDDLNDLMRTTLFGKVTGRLQVGKKGIIVRFEFEETRLRPEP